MDRQLISNFYTSYTAAFFMAAISGFSDVFGFIALDQLFTAHITGNIVIAIAFIIFKVKGVASKILAIPLFIIFASFISSLIETHGLTKKSLSFWLAIEIMLFLVLLIIGNQFIPSWNVTSWKYIAISMLPVCAMAVHNTLLKIFMKKIPPCTVMTGNLTQFVIDATAHCINRYRKTYESQQKSSAGIKKYGNVLVGFVFGGLLCTFGFIWIKFYALILIIMLLLAMIYCVYTRPWSDPLHPNAHTAAQ